MVTTAPVPFVLPPAATLPVERVFVLKLAVSADGQPLQGRVEHVLTGRHADFDDLGGLGALLSALQGGPSGGRP